MVSDVAVVTAENGDVDDDDDERNVSVSHANRYCAGRAHAVRLNSTGRPAAEGDGREAAAVAAGSPGSRTPSLCTALHGPGELSASAHGAVSGAGVLGRIVRDHCPGNLLKRD